MSARRSFFDNGEHVARFDVTFLLDANPRHAARRGGGDRIEHFHRFDDHQDVAGGHLVANCHLNIIHYAGQGETSEPGLTSSTATGKRGCSTSTDEPKGLST